MTALNWLLERVGERRHRQAVPLGDGAVLVYWTREAHPVLDAVPALLDEVAELVASPWRSGAPRAEVDGTTFYAAVLGTNRTRIVVREWVETTVAKLCTSCSGSAPCSCGIGSLSPISATVVVYRMRARGVDRKVAYRGGEPLIQRLTQDHNGLEDPEVPRPEDCGSQ